MNLTLCWALLRYCRVQTLKYFREAVTGLLTLPCADLEIFQREAVKGLLSFLGSCDWIDIPANSDNFVTLSSVFGEGVESSYLFWQKPTPTTTGSSRSTVLVRQLLPDMYRADQHFIVPCSGMMLKKEGWPFVGFWNRCGMTKPNIEGSVLQNEWILLFFNKSIINRLASSGLSSTVKSKPNHFLRHISPKVLKHLNQQKKTFENFNSCTELLHLQLSNRSKNGALCIKVWSMKTPTSFGTSTKKLWISNLIAK